MFVAGDGDGTIIWDVQSVSDDEYTVVRVSEMDGKRFETTATETKDTVMSQVYSNPGGIILMTTMITPSA